MPKIPGFRRRSRRSPSARRRSGYFRMPKGGDGFNRALDMGENTNLHKATSLILMLFIGMALYIGLLIPGINDLECGVDWDAEYDAWYERLDAAQKDDVAAAREIENNGARLQALRDADPTGTYPECDGGAFPGEPPVLSQSLNILVPFLPLFVLVPVLFLFFRQVGSIAALPAFLAAILLREFIPGDGLLDWVVITIGIVAACIPTPVKGLLSALSHIGALALWPTMMLAYHGTTGEINGEVAASVLTVMDFLVWLLPFGVLMMVPIRWRMKDVEPLV